MTESVEVPFIVVGNRHVLSDEQLVEDPELAAFVTRFLDALEYDPLRCVWILKCEE